jgi:hypothetical protein
MSAKHTHTSELVPGVLYCLFVIDESGPRDGALVYWTGEVFMDESGDERHDDWDYCVAQTSKPNPEFVVKQTQSKLHPEMEAIIANWQTLKAPKKAY